MALIKDSVDFAAVVAANLSFSCFIIFVQWCVLVESRTVISKPLTLSLTRLRLPADQIIHDIKTINKF